MKIKLYKFSSAALEPLCCEKPCITKQWSLILSRGLALGLYLSWALFSLLKWRFQAELVFSSIWLQEQGGCFWFCMRVPLTLKCHPQIPKFEPKEKSKKNTVWDILFCSFLFCVYWCFHYPYVWSPLVFLVPKEAKREFWPLELDLQTGYDNLYGCQKPNLGPSKEQKMLITAEISPPQCFFPCCFNGFFFWQ